LSSAILAQQFPAETSAESHGKEGVSLQHVRESSKFARTSQMPYENTYGIQTERLSVSSRLNDAFKPSLKFLFSFQRMRERLREEVQSRNTREGAQRRETERLLVLRKGVLSEIDARHSREVNISFAFDVSSNTTVFKFLDITRE
jgi:hypothetical protein